MPVSLEQRCAGARYTRDQGSMHDVAEERQNRAGHEDGNERSRGVAKDALYAERREAIKCRVHAEHHEVAMGEVDDPHDSENQSEADAHQAVDRADQQAGKQRLQKAFQELCHCEPLAGTPAVFKAALVFNSEARGDSSPQRAAMRLPSASRSQSSTSCSNSCARFAPIAAAAAP